MSQFLKSISIVELFCFFFCAFSFALSFSLYTLSVSMFGMSACIFFNDTNKGIRFNSGFLKGFVSLPKEPIFFWAILFYFSAFLSGIWSEECEEWINHARILAPFVVLPVVFNFHGRFNRKQTHFILFCGIISMFIQLSLVLMNYMNHYEEINQLILKGKAIPTPIPHIRFSLILASMILVLIYLITENLNKTFGLIKIIYVILLLYFFIGIHILSVKSGILGMYLGLCIMSLSYFYQKNQLKKLIWIIPLLCGILISMIYFVPSLQLKYYHLLWQIGEWSRGKYRLYSDIERWQSIQFGWDIIRDHPILGSGIGDMKSATQSIYLEKINSTDIKYPHNQFVFTWAFTGLLGLISLCSLLYYSLVHKFKQSHFLSTALLGMIWFSLLVEHGFETELGICLFFWILLISWNLNRFNMVKNNEVIITEV